MEMHVIAGRKGIIKDLDRGFYEEARRQEKHPLALLTELVNPEPPEIEAIERRLSAKFPALSAGSPLAQNVADWAFMVAGLEKELAARGISRSDTVEKAFFSSANGPNQPLFPVFLASQIIAGQMADSLVPHLVATELRINSHVQEKVTIADTAASRGSKNVTEGQELPKTSIARTSGSITLLKYGRMLEATYESVRLMHLDILALQLQRMGRQIGVDQSDQLIETLLEGDGNAGTAVAWITAESAGTLDYDELVRLFLQFPIGYRMRHAVINDAMLRTILNFAEFKDPMAGFRFTREGIIPGPMGAEWHRWTSTGSTAFGTDRILAVDDRMAAVLYREGDLLEEADQLIDKQMHRRTLSEWIGFAKWDNDASKALRLS
jgi:hypothetical protein